MDPNVTLAEMIQAARVAIRIADKLSARDISGLDSITHDYVTGLADTADTLAQRVADLDEWIRRGGALPADWQDR